MIFKSNQVQLLNILSLILASMIEADNRHVLEDGESTYKVYKFDSIFKNPLETNRVVKDDIILKFDIQDTKMILTYIVKIDKNEEPERIVYSTYFLSKDEKMKLIENILCDLKLDNEKSNDIYNKFYHMDDFKIFFILEETPEEHWK